MKNFESFLAPQLNEFITYRQNLGYATKNLLSYLKTFDRYIKKKNAEPDLLQPSFFLELRADLKMEPASVNKVLQATRGFFNFMIRREYCAENPLKDIPPLPENSFIPFIFSPEQVDQLLSAVCKRIRKTPKLFFKDLSVYIAILLMARCGLRISEPLNLQIDHYRSSERSLYIEKTKFKKDRLIPVPMAVAIEIENYLAVRNTLLYEDQNPYLLAGIKQNKLNENRVRFTFNKAVKDVGLNQQRQIIGNTTFASPTPHSCRHSFCVNTLKKIKERGDCPQKALPVLAAFLGHSCYQYTMKYLKVIDSKQRQGLFYFVNSQKEDI